MPNDKIYIIDNININRQLLINIISKNFIEISFILQKKYSFYENNLRNRLNFTICKINCVINNNK